MRLSAAKRGQLILLIVAGATGAAGYCVGRFQSVSSVKAAYGTGDGFRAPVQENSMSSSRARELYGKGLYAAAYEEAKRVLHENPSDAGAFSVAKLAKARLGLKPVSSKKSEDNRRRAQKHWNAGIIYFQAGDYAKSRDEWLLCRQFDPGNSDCQTGLQRLDNTYGSGS